MLLFSFVSIVSKLFTSLGLILLARYFGPENYGLYSTNLSIASIILSFVNFGMLDNLLINKNNKELISKTTTWLNVTVVISLIILFLLKEYLLAGIVLWSYFYRVVQMLFVGLGQLKNKYKLVSLVQIFYLITYLISIVLLYVFKLTLNEFVLVNILLSIIITFMLIVMNKNYKEQINFFKLDFSFDVLRQSYRYGYSGLFAFIYMSSDLIMIKYLKGDYEAGIYSVGTTFIFAFYFLSDIFYRFFLPKISKNHRESVTINNLISEFLYFTILFIFPVGLGILLFSYELVFYFFDKEFISSVDVLHLLAFAFLIHIFAYIPGIILTAINKQKQKNKIQIIVALFNIIANFYLIPIYSYMGAVYSTIASEALLLTMYLFSSLKYVENLKISFKHQIGVFLSIMISSFIVLEYINIAFLWKLIVALFILLVMYIVNKENVTKVLYAHK